MALAYNNLDPTTRQEMVAEIDYDRSNGSLYISPRLTSGGRAAWPDLITSAAQSENDQWLATQLRAQNLINATEQKRKPSGGHTDAKVPVTAPDTLAEGEFNRYYIRALAQRAIKGEHKLVVYRAKPVENPRFESEQKIGQSIEPAALLADLRTNIGVDTALGLPPGPNSGLTVRLEN